MANLLLLFVCLAAGAALRHWQVVAADAHVVLNQVLIWVLLPALTFLHLAVAQFDARFLLPVAMPWLVFGVGWVFFAAVGPRLGLSRDTVGALVLTGGISSVSFVGFPVFELLYGRPGLELGIVMSLAGSMLICVTLGVAVAAWYGAAEPSWRGIGGNVLRFPPFLAVLLAGLAHAAGYQHLPVVRALLERLGAAYPVVALLAVGLQLRLAAPGAQGQALGLGLAYKLGLAPLLVWAAYRGWAQQHALAVHLCVLGAAIGPMNTAAALATRYGLNPDLAAQMVGVGIPLSLPLLALLGWWLR